MKLAEPTLFRTTILAAAALAVFLTWQAPAAAIDGGSYSMEILVNGVPLHEHASRGKTYVEATEGREYSVRLRNRTGERVAIALSLDGLNSIDAKTTGAREAAKWILGPYETITIDGWQTSKSTARRFFFTTEEDSYGAWLGKTSNLGTISAAVFREKRPRPVRKYQPGKRLEKPSAGTDRDRPAGPAPGEMRGSEPMRESAGRVEAESQELSDDMAATGIGREVGHSVRQVRFRAEASPATVLQVRYEYHDALVRLGVLPRPLAHHEDPLSRRERARGFTDIPFAPDPYRR